MKIAVTGGSGGIGRAIVALAVKQGLNVVSIDRVSPAPDTISSRATFIKSDVANYDELLQAFGGCDAVIHMAAIPAPGMHPDQVVHNNNVVGSYNALRTAAELGIRRVCQASSVNALGLSYSRASRFDYFPLDEGHPTYNEDPYSLSKWICEMQGDSFARRYEDMVIASMRFHWVVPDRAATRTVGVRDPLTVKNIWAYTTFDAAARACLLSLAANFKGHEAFFIAAPHTMADVPSLALSAGFYPQVPVRGDLSGYRSFYDCRKAERLLGWQHDE
jgi:nucleoside-diphosphate-sugar epimerase